MAPQLGARFDSDTCAKCKKKFKPGDRVTTVFIVQKVGPNPNAQTPWDKGAFLGDEFELGHCSCPDPALESRLIDPT
jgi:hypothetical protein